MIQLLVRALICRVVVASMHAQHANSFHFVVQAKAFDLRRVCVRTRLSTVILPNLFFVRHV